MGQAKAPENARQATCILEPCGAHGLEGYQQGEKYRFDYRETGATDGKPYYRVWPTDDNYYETCGVRTFNQYFEPTEQQ